jgi:hypothetical protein
MQVPKLANTWDAIPGTSVALVTSAPLLLFTVVARYRTMASEISAALIVITSSSTHSPCDNSGSTNQTLSFEGLDSR